MKRIGMITMLVLFVTGAQAHKDEASQGWLSWAVEQTVCTVAIVGIYEGVLAVSPKAVALRTQVLERAAPWASMILKAVVAKLNKQVPPAPPAQLSKED